MTVLPRPGARPPQPVVLFVVTVLALFGAVVLVRAVHRLVAVFPAQALLGLALLVFTALVGWLVLARIRPLRAPPRARTLACLGWGMTAAAGCAILANDGLRTLWARTAGIDATSTWGAAFTAPLNEEILKAAGLVLLGLGLPGLVRGPMDGFVYGTLVGLGFQIVDNWIYGMTAIVEAGASAPTLSLAHSYAVRVLLTGLGSHWAMTGVAGAGVGYLFLRPRTGRRLAGAVGLLLVAMAMHWLSSSPLLGGVSGSLVKTAVNLAVAAAVYRILRRRVWDRARVVARRRGADRAVLRRGTRRRALRQIPAPGRPDARERQRAQLDAIEEYAYAGP